MAEKSLFIELNSINVNDKVEKKNNLSYLSWAYAVEEICKRHNSTFSYEIEKFENNLPYVYDEGVGFMVFTKITIDGIVRECWLPVLDNNNQAVLKETYSYKVKEYKWNAETRRKEATGKDIEKLVERCTMFDVNKAIMRCLVKNLAMFGLGLYIYAGEDLPVSYEEPISPEQIEKINELNVNVSNVLKRYKISTIEELSYTNAEFIISTKQKALELEKEKNEVK